MASSFGEQLRAAREARGITLREISDHTRIPMRYLEAIENNDYKPLPGGIFNRSFIKKYANYIEFDEAEAIAGYTRTARESGSPDEVNTSPRQPDVYLEGNNQRSPLATLFLMIIVLGVLSVGVYAALHWYQRRGAVATPPPVSTPMPVQASTPSPPPEQVAEFHVQVKAVGLPVWVQLTPDDNPSFESILKPGDTKEVSPSQQVNIKLAKINTSALQVTVNQKELKLPYEIKGNSAEFILRRNEFSQYVQ
jgi:cytoskeleton protein RodZ